MLDGTELVLRDIHQLQIPSWWPPAPGWWMVFLFILAIVAVTAWVFFRYRARRRKVIELFDNGVSMATTSQKKIAMISELLRRAARRHDIHADRLQGDAWAQFLNHEKTVPKFSDSQINLLLNGSFQREVDEADIADILPHVRRKFLYWMR